MSAKFYIPQFVSDMLGRSQFAVYTHYLAENDDPSYTILIPKRTAYSQVGTLAGEVDCFAKWAKRMMPADYDWENAPAVVIRRMPDKTRYCRQFARVDIYDPIMQRIEHLIKNNAKQF